MHPHALGFLQLLEAGSLNNCPVLFIPSEASGSSHCQRQDTELHGSLPGTQSLVVSSRPCPNHATTTCPVNWIGSQGKTYPWKCYYFSKVDGDWNSSQRNCSSLGASLATVDTREEKEFMLHYKGRSETWIGLTRDQADKPWKWVNDTPFNDHYMTYASWESAPLTPTGLFVF
uniref:C-type lectin domain-containing protein n=1 Tax=Terrapene triunguis TaxID=2587831 RepID=A0A674J189_9SAUR